MAAPGRLSGLGAIVLLASLANAQYPPLPDEFTQLAPTCYELGSTVPEPCNLLVVIQTGSGGLLGAEAWSPTTDRQFIALSPNGSVWAESPSGYPYAAEFHGVYYVTDQLHWFSSVDGLHWSPDSNITAPPAFPIFTTSNRAFYIDGPFYPDSSIITYGQLYSSSDLVHWDGPTLLQNLSFHISQPTGQFLDDRVVIGMKSVWPTDSLPTPYIISDNGTATALPTNLQGTLADYGGLSDFSASRSQTALVHASQENFALGTAGLVPCCNYDSATSITHLSISTQGYATSAATIDVPTMAGLLWEFGVISGSQLAFTGPQMMVEYQNIWRTPPPGLLYEYANDYLLYSTDGGTSFSPIWSYGPCQLNPPTCDPGPLSPNGSDLLPPIRSMAGLRGALFLVWCSDSIAGCGFPAAQLFQLGSVNDVMLQTFEIEEGIYGSRDYRRVGSHSYPGNPLRLHFVIQNFSRTEVNCEIHVVNEFNGDDFGTWPVSATQGSSIAEMDYDSNGITASLSVQNELQLRAELSCGDQFTVARAPLDLWPRPIALLHGMWSNSATWADVIPTLAQYYEVFDVDNMYTGRPAPGSPPSNSIHVNATLARGSIGDWLRDHNAWQVNLVGHSMGGLISREVRSLFGTPPGATHPTVNKVVTLGTPHLGSPCAERILSPDVIEETPEALASFNSRFPLFPDYLTFVMAGNYYSDVDACGFGEANDGLVGVHSASWQDVIADPFVASVRHTAMTSSQDLMNAFVIPSLDGNSSPKVNLETPQGLIEQPVALLDDGDRCIDPNDVLSISVSRTEGSSISAFLAGPLDGLTGELRAPDGLAIELDIDQIYGQAVDQRLMTGDYELTIQNHSNVQTCFSASIAEIGASSDLALRASNQGGMVVLEAYSKNNPLSQVEATLFATARSPVSLSLHDDGQLPDAVADDGIFSGYVEAADVSPAQFCSSIVRGEIQAQPVIETIVFACIDRLFVSGFD